MPDVVLYSTSTTNKTWTLVDVSTFGSNQVHYWPAEYPADPPLRGERKLVKLYGIEMDRTEAQRQLDLYSTIPEPELTDHERELIALYDAIASVNGKVVDLDMVWNTDQDERQMTRLPKMAVAPVKAAEVTLTREAIRDHLYVGEEKRRRLILVNTLSAPGWRWRAPGIHFHRNERNYTTGMAVAKVPSVNPLYRDKVQDGDLILWEPTWTQTRLTQHSRPDPDPAILRHVTGSLYRVIAAWDLTPVEMRILGR